MHEQMGNIFERSNEEETVTTSNYVAVRSVDMHVGRRSHDGLTLWSLLDPRFSPIAYLHLLPILLLVHFRSASLV
jgi:hypothetical protein